MQAIDYFFPPIGFRLGIGNSDKMELSDDLGGLASLISAPWLNVSRVRATRLPGCNGPFSTAANSPQTERTVKPFNFTVPGVDT